MCKRARLEDQVHNNQIRLTKINRNLVLATAIMALGMGVVSANAASFYWDADGTGASGNPPTSGVGGSGTWDTTSSDWWTGTAYSTWNTNTNTADFSGTAGSVTIASGGVTAGGLAFNTTGYSLDGTGTLTVPSGAVTPAITLATGVIATINTPFVLNNTSSTTFIPSLASGSNLIINGVLSGNVTTTYFLSLTGGTITLAGNNQQTKSMLMRGGTLNINNAHALGTAGINFNTSTTNVIDNTSGAPITVTNNGVSWLTDFTFTGSNNLSFGTSAVSLGANSTTTLQRKVTVTQNTLTFGGAIGGA